jgi:hypothetical protein
LYTEATDHTDPHGDIIKKELELQRDKEILSYTEDTEYKDTFRKIDKKIAVM